MGISKIKIYIFASIVCQRHTSIIVNIFLPNRPAHRLIAIQEIASYDSLEIMPSFVGQ